MEEIIVIRAVDPDENVFQAIMDALHGKSVQVIEATSSVRQDWVNEICWTWLISTVPSIFFCLFAFSFSFSVGHIGFPSLVNRGFQVFGQFQNLY